MTIKARITQLEWKGEEIQLPEAGLKLEGESGDKAYLRFEVEDDGRKLDIDVQVKFDDEGIVIDVFDNNYQCPDPQISTWDLYANFMTKEEAADCKEIDEALGRLSDPNNSGN